MVKKIKPIGMSISQTLADEIHYAKKNLNKAEANKSTGKKKKTWTLLEASHELGKHLNSLRDKIK